MRAAEPGDAHDKKTIIITGASGNLGSKLARHMIINNHPVILLDQLPHPNLPVRTVDLSAPGSWMRLFSGADVVVHLAGSAEPGSSHSIFKTQNIDCTANILSACETYGVRRIVFASSLRVMDGYRGSGKRLAETLPAKPDGAFGRSKLACETMLSRFPDVICLRLGWCPRRNRQDYVLRASPRLREMWLSDDDFLQAVSRCIDVEDSGVTVLNITSRAAKGTYPLKAAYDVLGYRPVSKLNTTQLLFFRIARGLSGRGGRTR